MEINIHEKFVRQVGSFTTITPSLGLAMHILLTLYVEGNFELR